MPYHPGPTELREALHSIGNAVMAAISYGIDRATQQNVDVSERMLNAFVTDLCRTLFGRDLHESEWAQIWEVAEQPPAA